MDKLNVKNERYFSAHHMLLGAARMAMEDAEAKRPGWFYSHLMIIISSALAIEAIANAFGKRFIDKWEDFESSSPIAKIRIICTRFAVDMKAGSEPWATVIWLMGLRNKIVHAKPEFLKESRIWTREGYDQCRMEGPKSKIESQITLGNARRAFRAATEVRDLFCDLIPIEDQDGLLCDGWTGSASRADDN
jgi:hypothetical protein